MSNREEPTSHAPRLTLGYRIARLGRLIRKELSEILRDRRTILTLVLMPLLLYPLISIALQQYYFASGLDLKTEEGYRVGFLNDHEAQVFLALMAEGERVRQTQSKAKERTSDLPPLFSPKRSKTAMTQEELDTAIIEGVIDLGVRIPNAASVKLTAEGILPREPHDEDLACEIHYKRESLRGITAATQVERYLAAANRAAFATRLGLKDVWPKVVLMRPQLTALHTEGGGILSLSALLPLVLILMTMTGAVYPAIDLTAGERERGTLEMLIAAPVPRLSLLFAKYVTVVTVATLTAVVNLTAMLATLVLSGLFDQVFDRGLDVLLIVQLLALLLLFAAFFSAVLLSLTSFARSFKEGQAYLIPVMLVSFTPGMIGMMPGLKLNFGLMMVPLLNIVLLGRDLLDNRAEPLAAVVIVMSTLLYAMAAIAVAARFFGSESVLFGTQSGWSELWRRPRQPQPHASVATAFMVLALMLPTWFTLRNIIIGLGMPIQDMLLLIASLSVLLFAGFPAAAAVHRRIAWGSGFRLRPARVLAFVAAGILGVSAWPWVFQLLTLIQDWVALDPQAYETQLRAVRAATNNFPMLMAICTIIPAIVEELFFRGFLFSALRGKLSDIATLLITTLLFGFFHVITGLFIQLIPSLILGLLLGWICLRSGSVLPGMLMHALHNGMMVAMGASELAASNVVPIAWLVSGIAATVVALVVLQLETRPRNA